MTTTTFTGGVLKDYVPWANTDSTNYLTALSQMFEAVFGIVSSQGDPDEPLTYAPGWGSLLDPDSCPTDLLPYLSMFNGTGVQQGTDEATARAVIKAESGLWRGTLSAMQAAAARNLNPGATLVILERTAPGGASDPYAMVVVFQAADCPSQSLLVEAVEAQKPAGIQVSYAATTGFPWLEATGTWTSDTMSWAETTFLEP